MNFMTTFAHAGHSHAAPANDSSLGLVFVIGVVALAAVAAVLIVLNRRQKKPAPVQDEDGSADEKNGV